MKFKKLLSAFLVLCTAVSLSGCVKNPFSLFRQQEDFFLDIKVGSSSFRELSGGEIISETAADEIILSGEHKEKYPALSAALEKINKENLYGAKDSSEELAELVRDAKQYSPYVSMFTSKQSVNVVRADKNVLSYVEYVSEYTGGAHPLHGEIGINLDPETGNELKLSEVLTDTDGIYAILTEKLLDKYGEDFFFSNPQETLKEYEEDSYNWVLDYQGISFFFNPYEIAPYAAGTPTVKLWFNESPELFNTKYTEQPKNGCIIPIPENSGIEVDLYPDDGKVDTISVSRDYSSEYDLTTVIIDVNGLKYKNKDIFGYNFDALYATKDGKNYLIICSVADNDYSFIHIAEITPDSVEFAESMSGFGFGGDSSENVFGEFVSLEPVVNNTEKIRLETRIDILGTRFGQANFRLDTKSAALEMTEKDYSLEHGAPVTAAITVEAKTPDGETTEIAPGTVLYPLRSDRKTYIDMETGDGTTFRIEVNSESYPVTVNGKPETECFSDIMYAG